MLIRQNLMKTEQKPAKRRKFEENRATPIKQMIKTEQNRDNLRKIELNRAKPIKTAIKEQNRENPRITAKFSKCDQNRANLT